MKKNIKNKIPIKLLLESSKEFLKTHFNKYFVSIIVVFFITYCLVEAYKEAIEVFGKNPYFLKFTTSLFFMQNDFINSLKTLFPLFLIWIICTSESMLRAIIPYFVGYWWFLLLDKKLRTIGMESPAAYSKSGIKMPGTFINLFIAILCLFLAFSLYKVMKKSVKIGFLTTGFIFFAAIFQFGFFSDFLRFVGLAFCIIAAIIHFFETLGVKRN